MDSEPKIFKFSHPSGDCRPLVRSWTCGCSGSGGGRLQPRAMIEPFASRPMRNAPNREDTVLVRAREGRSNAGGLVAEIPAVGAWQDGGADWVRGSHNRMTGAGISPADPAGPASAAQHEEKLPPDFVDVLCQEARQLSVKRSASERSLLALAETPSSSPSHHEPAVFQFTWAWMRVGFVMCVALSASPVFLGVKYSLLVFSILTWILLLVVDTDDSVARTEDDARGCQQEEDQELLFPF